MKKKNKENNEEQKALKKVKGEKFKDKLIRNMKKRWIVSGLNTLILIAILIALFVLINVAVKKADFTAIDCTTSQDFTLTDESKERVADIDEEVKIYFVGYDESSQDYILAKQYNKANSNITVELVDISENVEIQKKYDLTTDSDPTIIIECGDSSRTIDYYDTYTYDSSYNTVDIAEQKITSAILNVTSDVIPKVYYLTGYTSYSLTSDLTALAQYLDDEVLTYEELSILNTEKVPDDCNTLIIMTPEKDFDTLVADAIIEYINKGGNILWLNGAYTEDLGLTNVNRVLAEFGVNSFEPGLVFETNSSNTVLNSQLCFIPEVQYTTVTKDVYTGSGTLFAYATKININSDKLEELNVEETDLVLSSDTSYYSKDVTGTSLSKDEQGSFVLGAQMVKTIQEAAESDDEETEDTEAITSTLIIYANDAFATDYQLNSGTGSMIYLFNNADLVLNSIADLTNIDQDITIRKSYSDSQTSFTPTDEEEANIMKIIFIVPIVIILAGIIVWSVRRRRK